MRDDKPLQRLLLRQIEQSDHTDHDTLLEQVQWHTKRSVAPYKADIGHQLKLLEERGAIKRSAAYRYAITAAGHAWLRPWYQRLGSAIVKRLDAIITAAITSLIVTLAAELAKHLLGAKQ